MITLVSQKFSKDTMIKNTICHTVLNIVTLKKNLENLFVAMVKPHMTSCYGKPHMTSCYGRMVKPHMTSCYGKPHMTSCYGEHHVNSCYCMVTPPPMWPVAMVSTLWPVASMNPMWPVVTDIAEWRTWRMMLSGPRLSSRKLRNFRTMSPSTRRPARTDKQMWVGHVETRVMVLCVYLVFLLLFHTRGSIHKTT